VIEFLKDEASQVYFTFPIQVLDMYMNAAICVGVCKEVLKTLYERLEGGE